MEIRPIRPYPKEPVEPGRGFEYWKDRAYHHQARSEMAEEILASIFDKDACTCKICIEPDRNNYQQLKRLIAASESNGGQHG